MPLEQGTGKECCLPLFSSEELGLAPLLYSCCGPDSPTSEELRSLPPLLSSSCVPQPLCDPICGPGASLQRPRDPHISRLGAHELLEGLQKYFQPGKKRRCLLWLAYKHNRVPPICALILSPRLSDVLGQGQPRSCISDSKYEFK